MCSQNIFYICVNQSYNKQTFYTDAAEHVYTNYKLKCTSAKSALAKTVKNVHRFSTTEKGIRVPQSQSKVNGGSRWREMHFQGNVYDGQIPFIPSPFVFLLLCFNGSTPCGSALRMCCGWCFAAPATQSVILPKGQKKPTITGMRESEVPRSSVFETSCTAP